MTDTQLIKTIQKAVKDEVRPLKEQVEIVKSQVSKLDMYQSGTSHNVKTTKEQLSVVNEKLDALQEIKEIVEDRIYPSVMEIELNIKAYGDMYKINNDNARKLEKRVMTLEDRADIQPPPELSIADVT